MCFVLYFVLLLPKLKMFLNAYHLIFFAEFSTESITVVNIWKHLHVHPQVFSDTSVSV